MNAKDSYAKITDYIHQKGYEVTVPSREIYIKGPGMIFPRDPSRFVTEIQAPVAK